ncbi:MAG: CHASE4 domain-containing protein [Chloroflexota bacterium]
MKLRQKTLLIIGVTLVTLTLLLDLFSRVIILNSFDNLQAEMVQRNLQRAQKSVNTAVWQLDAALGDWAPWDDTYQFVQDMNTDYIDDNLADETLINLKVNFMLFINPSGQIAFAKSVDFTTGTEAPLPPDLYPNIAPGSLLLNHTKNDSSVAGILLLKEGPTMIASQPITKNNHGGAIHGTLIFGRYLDDSVVQRIANELDLSLAVEPYATPSGDDFTRARSAFGRSSPAPVVAPLDDQNIAGYSTLFDIYGRPALILRVDTPAKIARQGQDSVSFFIVALLVSGLAVGLTIILLLDKYVLSRLTQLHQALSDIGTTRSFEKRVDECGSDELSGLGHGVNILLESIDQSQNQLQNLNAELEHSLTELRMVQEQKDRFFTHAGHEFRTPLANLRTRLYLARKKPSHLADHLEVLERVTDQMIALVEDVFDVARYSNRTLELHEHHVHLPDIVHTVCAEQLPKAAAKGLKVSQKFTETDAVVYADAGKLKQALTNVFAYVINFTPVPAHMSIQLSTLSDEAIIQIDSDSLDVKSEAASQIFQPFFRASEGASITTGLSLTLAKEIIELHFGRITFETNGHGGGTFTVRLLLMEDALAEKREPPVLIGVNLD